MHATRGCGKCVRGSSASNVHEAVRSWLTRVNREIVFRERERFALSVGRFAVRSDVMDDSRYAVRDLCQSGEVVISTAKERSS